MLLFKDENTLMVVKFLLQCCTGFGDGYLQAPVGKRRKKLFKFGIIEKYFGECCFCGLFCNQSCFACKPAFNCGQPPHKSCEERRYFFVRRSFFEACGDQVKHILVRSIFGAEDKSFRMNIAIHQLDHGFTGIPHINKTGDAFAIPWKFVVYRFENAR